MTAMALCTSLSRRVIRQVSRLVCAVGFGINDCLARALVLLAGGAACFAASFVLDLVLFAGTLGMWIGAESIRCLRLIVGFVVTDNCAVVGTTLGAKLSSMS